MASGAQGDGFRFPEIEFGLADGRVVVSVTDPDVGSSDRAGSSEGRPHRLISPPDVGALIRLAEEAAQRVDAGLPRHLARRDRTARRLARASRLPLAPFLSWRLPALRSAATAAEDELQVAAGKRNACRIRVRFGFGGRAERAYLAVVSAFDRLCRTGAAWEVGSIPPTPPLHPVPGPQFQREEVRFVPTFTMSMDAGWPGLAARKASGSSLELYPGFALLRAGDDLSLTSPLETSLEFSERVVAEAIQPAGDATIEHLAWERANKDGTPDRRYANNRSVPFVRYGLISVRVPGIPPRGFLISDLQAARDFASAFADYRRILSEEAQGARGATGRQAPLTEVTNPDADDRSVVTVPPPPRTARAHEYTVAAVVAAVCAWGVLSDPSLSGQTMDWASQQSPDRIAPSAVEAPVIATGPSVVQAQAPAPPDSAPASAPQPISPFPVPEGSPALPPDSPAPEASPPATAAAPAVREQIVTRSGANIRSAPNGAADVLRTTSGGTRLNVFGRSAGWVRVGDTEAWGWIHSSLLDTAR